MLRVDTSKADVFLDNEKLKATKNKARKCFDKVKSGSGTGSEWLGWRRILDEPNDAQLEQIDTLAEQLRREIDVFVVCGIGGSYLGAKALIEALKPAFKQPDDVEVIFAGHHMGGKYVKELIEYLEVPKADGTPKQVAVNVISKSGTTLETMLSFRMLRKWMQNHFPEVASERIICTTGPTGGVLNAMADRHGYKRFAIPDDVGGRFSVLTPVGLIPAAMAGIDVRALFYQAVSKYKELDNDPSELLKYASVRYLFEVGDKSIDLITSFEPELHGFSQWLQQLLGESEGKEGRGLFPVAAQYSTDLHSLGQFVQQGASHMIETYLEVENSKKSLKIEELENNDDELNYLSGYTFHQINQKALQATRQAHDDGDVPCISIVMAELNEQNIGEFIYFFELFTAVYCYMLDVNPFNQPGVEDYKRGMYKLLGKQ